MGNLYVRSTDGNDADNGTTWALAKATLAGAAAIDSAGDVIYLSQVHAESNAATQTIALAGTLASPVKVICGNDAAEPPTAVATTASVTTTGTTNINISGNGYLYGIIFSAASGAVNAYLSLNSYNTTSNSHEMYESCDFILGCTGTGSKITVNYYGPSGAANAAMNTTVWKNCRVSLGGSSQSIDITGKFIWEGGSVISGSATNTSGIFTNNVGSGRGGTWEVSGVDFSNMSSSLTLCAANTSHLTRGVFRDCKLPAAWSGSLVSGTIGVASRYELYNCDAGDTNYRIWIEDYWGSLKQETTLIKTGGASDGTTGISWKVVTTADVEYPALVFSTHEIARWNTTVGSAITVTVDILHDSLTSLTDAEVWLEVQYLGTSGFPLSTFISDCKADVLASAANQTASSAAWTTTGMTNPNKQKLAVTFTPQEVGHIIAKVIVAKASYTLYIDPVLQVS